MVVSMRRLGAQAWLDVLLRGDASSALVGCMHRVRCIAMHIQRQCCVEVHACGFCARAAAAGCRGAGLLAAGAPSCLSAPRALCGPQVSDDGPEQPPGPFILDCSQPQELEAWVQAARVSSAGAAQRTHPSGDAGNPFS
jgi:hypothetical protein